MVSLEIILVFMNAKLMLKLRNVWVLLRRIWQIDIILVIMIHFVIFVIYLRSINLFFTIRLGFLLDISIFPIESLIIINLIIIFRKLLLFFLDSVNFRLPDMNLPLIWLLWINWGVCQQLDRPGLVMSEIYKGLLSWRNWNLTIWLIGLREN